MAFIDKWIKNVLQEELGCLLFSPSVFIKNSSQNIRLWWNIYVGQFWTNFGPLKVFPGRLGANKVKSGLKRKLNGLKNHYCLFLLCFDRGRAQTRNWMFSFLKKCWQNERENIYSHLGCFNSSIEGQIKKMVLCMRFSFQFYISSINSPLTTK